MPGSPAPTVPDSQMVTGLRAAMEAVALGLVVATPWAFSGVDPASQLGLAVGIAVLLMLWAALAVAAGRFDVAVGPVGLSLAGVALIGLVQLVPLPPAVHRAVSPGSADLRQDLLPAQPEKLTPDEAVPAAAASWPLTVYPYATRLEAVRWLAVLALFLAVRSAVAGPAAFRRLCVAVTINGALLGLFGIAHWLTARPQRLFWNLEILGNAFGPFPYRNQYAAYANLSLGLGLGLLLAARPASGRSGDHDRSGRDQDDRGTSLTGVLSAPGQAWTCLGLALMLGGLVCCLSRGGVASFAVAVAVVVALRLRLGSRVPFRLDLVLLPVAILAGLLVLVGVNPLETRLATLGTDAALSDQRWEIWRNTLAIVPHFPLVGCGYGTLAMVEPVYRVLPRTTAWADWGVVDFAHNDYLQALAEGGIVRLLLAVALAVAAVRLGWRAVHRHAGRRDGGLALGGLLAVVALALHALYDFVTPNPAVAVLAAVIVAQISALAATPVDGSAAVLSVRLGWTGRVVVPAALATVGAVLVLQAWQARQVHRLRLGAFVALRGPRADFDAAVGLLTAAAQTAPDNAVVEADLGQVYLDARRAVADRRRVAAAAGVPAAGGFAAVAAALSWQDAAVSPPVVPPSDRFLIPALRHLAAARAVCPLLPLPHLRFAAFAAGLTRADPPAVYWDRARRLAPYDPDLWFLGGSQRLLDGDSAGAVRDWRRSLELSDRHFEDVMALVLAGRAGPPADAVAQVVPDDPDLLVRAALEFGGGSATGGPARTLLNRARAIVAARPEPRRPADEYLGAQIERWLGNDAAALAAFERTVQMAPERWDWRLDYARLLVEEEYWDRAAEELRRLTGRTANREAAELLGRVEREQAIDPGPRVDHVPPPPPRDGSLDRVAAAAPAGQFAEAAPDFPRASQIVPIEATVRITRPATGEVGSGVAIARDHNLVYVVTAAHVVPAGPSGDDVDVEFYSVADWPKRRGSVRRGTVKARAEDADVAVLWVVAPDAPAVLPLCPPGGMRGRRLPLPVLTVGCDRGAPTAVADRVGAVRFVAEPRRGNFFEADHAQAPGRSGGPLVDARGHLIGICSGTRGGKGYYATSAEVRHALRQAGFDRVVDGPAGAGH